MLPRFAKGKFTCKNPDKYIGLKTPTYRSSWEQAFMRLCDEHPNVAKWASESIKIPYRHPFSGKYTVYVPDFFVVYSDKEGRKHAELIEVKPMAQSTLEAAGILVQRTGVRFPTVFLIFLDIMHAFYGGQMAE